MLSLLTLASTPNLPDLRVRADVRDAIANNRPVVALESTIISHGMPYPKNLEVARAVEAVVRDAGALPCTIAVLDGVCICGLSDDELERFAQLGDAGAVGKVSRRDLAHAVARGAHGGTTVSSTMLLAHAAGIGVFVTGGIGGVHRGGEASMDVSADLVELGRTPVLVVSAGVKSILDIPRTLEYLETQGVAVLALGADEFPAFFSRTSGCAAPLRVDSAAEAAAVAAAQRRLGLASGMLVGVPIPEAAEAEGARVQGAIDAALAEADGAGVRGRDVTPFLLKRVNELTDGASLAANIALIKNNALAGAQIAVALSAMAASPDAPEVAGVGVAPATSAEPVVVIGGVVADLVASPPAGGALLPRTSTPGALALSPGGVARNVAEGLARLGVAARLLSAVGDDALAAMVDAHAAGTPLQTGDIRRVAGARTATYTAMHDGRGDLASAVADMDVLDQITPDYVGSYAAAIGAAPLCVADANLRADTLVELARMCDGMRTPLWLEPVSIQKGAAAAAALRGAGLLGVVAFTSPNEEEVVAMAAGAPPLEGAPPPTDEAVREAAARLLREGVAHVVVSRGARGVLWAAGDGEGGARFEAFAAEEAAEGVASTRGAGDAFAAGAVWRLVQVHAAGGVGGDDAVRAAICSGLRAARLTVEEEGAVSTRLCAELLE